MVKCFLATSDQRYRQSYSFYLSRSFLKVMDVSRIKLFSRLPDLLPDLLQTAGDHLSVQKEEKHQDEVNCGDVLPHVGRETAEEENGSPRIRWEVILCCKARSHASVGACVHVATPVPALSTCPEQGRSPRRCTIHSAQFSATGVEGGWRPPPRGSDEMRQKTRRQLLRIRRP